MGKALLINYDPIKKFFFCYFLERLAILNENSAMFSDGNEFLNW